LCHPENKQREPIKDHFNSIDVVASFHLGAMVVSAFEMNKNQRATKQAMKSAGRTHRDPDEFESKGADINSKENTSAAEERRSGNIAKKKTTGPVHNAKYKAKLCKNWTIKGACQYFEKQVYLRAFVCIFFLLCMLWLLCLALLGLAWPCLALLGLAWPCSALLGLALPCLALPCFT
jgi:hypothetical protein